MTETGPPLHEALEPLRFLLGTWRGAGAGSYPTIADFGYLEEITFGHVGKPFLAYGQKTRHAETNLPLHAESGYWRSTGGGPTPDVELVLAHPTGILESLAGTFEPTASGGIITLACPAVTRTATAVDVGETTRRFAIDGDTLTYDVAMAAVGVPLTHHLSAELHRVVA